MALTVAVFVGVVLVRMIQIVPQQRAYVLERLGKYHRTIGAGLHFIIPFVDRIAYRHTLKEIVIDIPEQICITKDNVQVGIDGIVFFRVVDPHLASYGVNDYMFAIIQLAQTTMRSEVGKMDLDRTFEEREHINNSIVMAIDKATDPWGVKVLRYELKSITPPKDVLEAMEKQMRAEREKRAAILYSEGERESKINRAEGDKQEVIKQSEAQRQRQINEAQGEAEAILAVATATAEGLRQVAHVLNAPGGHESARLRVAEQWVTEFGRMAQNSNTMIVPSNTSDMSGMLATAFSLFDNARKPTSLPTT